MRDDERCPVPGCGLECGHPLEVSDNWVTVHCHIHGKVKYNNKTSELQKEL